MNKVLANLEHELAKRSGPWRDGKGNVKARLYNVVTLMPTDALELLRLAKLGHTKEKEVEPDQN